jgi:hypothetical protein
MLFYNRGKNARHKWRTSAACGKRDKVSSDWARKYGLGRIWPASDGVAIPKRSSSPFDSFRQQSGRSASQMNSLIAAIRILRQSNSGVK